MGWALAYGREGLVAFVPIASPPSIANPPIFRLTPFLRNLPHMAIIATERSHYLAPSLFLFVFVYIALQVCICVIGGARDWDDVDTTTTVWHLCRGELRRLADPCSREVGTIVMIR